MKTFNEFREITKFQTEPIKHQWATHVYHPSLGEVKVESHSLTEDGIIEEYYVMNEGEEITLEAKKVQVTKFESHGHSPKPKKKKKWRVSKNT